MPDLQATHVQPPLLGSKFKGSRTFADFLENIPIDGLNPNFYNYWSLNPALDVLTAVGTTPGPNGFTFEDGSGPTNPTALALSAAGGLILATAANDNDECLAGGPQIFVPMADNPIYYLFEGRLADVSATFGYFGLAAISDFTAAGPLVAATGALGAVDTIGFRLPAGATIAPVLSIVDGAGTPDTLSMAGAALGDADDFRLALAVRSTVVDYYYADDNGVRVTGTIDPTNTTLTNLTAMRPVFVHQNNGAGANSITAWRCFVAQKKRYTASFITW